MCIRDRRNELKAGLVGVSGRSDQGKGKGRGEGEGRCQYLLMNIHNPAFTGRSKAGTRIVACILGIPALFF